MKSRKLPNKQRLIFPKLNASIIALVILLAGPNMAAAGFLSYLGDILSPGTEVSAKGAPLTYPQQSTSLLVPAVNPDPNPAKGGGDIIIEDGALVPAITPDGSNIVDTHVGSDQIALYTVRAGDTLSSIAKLYGVSVNTIRWANDISRADNIRIDQELLILPISGVRYTVKKGDTIKSIATKYKGDLAEILNYNLLSVDDALAVGQVVIIPDGVIAPPAPVKSNTTKSANNVAKYTGPTIAGYYLRPVPGPRTQGLHGNNGVDIGGAMGTPILASASGEVIIARGSGYNGGYGQYVVITHENGTQSLYAHMSQVTVSAGQYVQKGQKIGEVGNSGRSTGPHLHFEVRGAKNPF